MKQDVCRGIGKGIRREGFKETLQREREGSDFEKGTTNRRERTESDTTFCRSPTQRPTVYRRWYPPSHRLMRVPGRGTTGRSTGGRSPGSYCARSIGGKWHDNPPTKGPDHTSSKSRALPVSTDYALVRRDSGPSGVETLYFVYDEESRTPLS